jgi:beta-galactosidase
MDQNVTLRTVFVILALASSAAIGQVRHETLLTSGWRFTREDVPAASEPGFNDGYWEKVTVPHTWNARDGQDGGNDYYRGTGWYRTSVTVPRTERGRTIMLRFDGAGTATTVYVNGRAVGSHRGAYGGFAFDVTNAVEPGRPAVIAVRVNNSRDTAIAPLRGDFTVFGGLYRPVRLVTLSPVGISPFDHASSGVYVTPRNITDTTADVHVRSVVRNVRNGEAAVQVRTSLLDAKGRVLGAATATVTLPAGSTNAVEAILTLGKPRRWDGRRDPYQYRARVEVLEGKKVVDLVEESFGIRTFSIDPARGAFLNGRHYPIYGVNRHQDRLNMGSAITKKEHLEDFRLIEEIGANGIRLAHYQQAPEFYDLCDAGGMVVWAELALVDEAHPSPAFLENAKQQLTELILQNYNRPSIMFWGLQNEFMPESNPELYARVVRELNELAKSLDATRLTAVASRSKYEPSEPMNATSDVLGYNVYRGWYEGRPENFAKFADELRRDYPGRPIGITEYGAGGSIFQHEWPSKRPNTKGPWHPEEWQSVLHEVTWKLMAERPFLWGTFVWNMFDFASDGRSEGDRMGINDKGLVTYDRKIRKDAFYWYKANWNPQPMVHITSKRFNPRPAGATDIRVYSNCDSVSLRVGAVNYGMKTSADRLSVWPEVLLQSGTNKVRVEGWRGGRKLVEECRWQVE